MIWRNFVVRDILASEIDIDSRAVVVKPFRTREGSPPDVKTNITKPRKRKAMDFVCPKCKGEMKEYGGVCRCALGHSYDRARAGYYNLLLGASGGTHGDNREMVEARCAFLSAGYYAPLAERVAALTVGYTPRGGALLDAGCGEGYYTDLCERALRERDENSRVLAFDISRDAVRFAARRNRNISFAVASSYDIPLGEGSVDTALNVFSPTALDEMRRVIKVGGHLIYVYPGEEHLWEMKAAIYDEPYKNTPEDTARDGFALVLQERVRYGIHLDAAEAIRSLFMMTPYAYRTGRAERERLEALTKLDTRVEFCIDVYERL